MSETSALMDTLRQEGISPDLLRAVEEYRTAHPLAEAPCAPASPPLPSSTYGREVWGRRWPPCSAAKNLLLAGGKATGKNVLAENPLRRLRTPRVGHLVPRQYGRGVPHRHGHL